MGFPTQPAPGEAKGDFRLGRDGSASGAMSTKLVEVVDDLSLNIDQLPNFSWVSLLQSRAWGVTKFLRLTIQ